MEGVPGEEGGELVGGDARPRSPVGGTGQFAEPAGPGHGPALVQQVGGSAEDGVAGKQLVPAQSAEGDRQAGLFGGLGDDKGVRTIATGVVGGGQRIRHRVQEVIG